MANWCMTVIKIYSENKDKLTELKGLLKEWTRDDSNLGNIVVGAGFGTWNENGYLDSDLECRGGLCYAELCEDCLLIEAETAWKPMLELWVRLLEKYLPDGKLIYYAEEMGNEIYCSNDPEYKDLYYVDFEDIDHICELIGYDIESFMDAHEIKEKDLRKCLQLLLKTDEDDIETLIELASEYDEDDIYILKCQYCEPEDFDDFYYS